MRKLASLFFAAAALSATSASANLCDVLIRDGVLDGICDLASMYGKDQQLQGKFDYRPRHTLELPNLVPDGFGYFVNGSFMQLSLDVENQNLPDSGAFDAHVTVIVEQYGRRVGYNEYTVRFNGVTGGSTASEFVAPVPLANRDYDNDVIVLVSVDTPTTIRPRGGVVESNENDNSRTRVCRVYGRVQADTSVRACN